MVGIGNTAEVVANWSSSKPTNAFLAANLIAAFYLLTIWAIKWAFLGRMNAYETEKFREKVKELIFTKAAFLLALTHIDQLRMPFWALWFTATGALRVFLGLAKYRFKVLGQSPTLSAYPQARNALLLALTLVMNHVVGAVAFSVWPSAHPRHPRLTLYYRHDPDRPLFFPWPLAILAMMDPLINFAEGFEVASRYVLLAIDHLRMRRADRRGWAFAPLDGQGTLAFQLKLGTKMIATALTLIQHVMIGLMAGVFRFHLAEMMVMLSIRGCITTLIGTVRLLVRYRSITRKVKSRFPDATTEDLERSGHECAICLEAMHTCHEAKRLPCTHVFHLVCLTKLFEQPQRNAPSCPLCRAPVTSQGKTNETIRGGRRARRGRGGEGRDRAHGGARMRHGDLDDGDDAPVIPPPEARMASRPSISWSDLEDSRGGRGGAVSIASDQARLDLGAPDPENEGSVWHPGDDWAPPPFPQEGRDGGDVAGPSEPMVALGGHAHALRKRRKRHAATAAAEAAHAIEAEAGLHGAAPLGEIEPAPAPPIAAADPDNDPDPLEPPPGRTRGEGAGPGPGTRRMGRGGVGVRRQGRPAVSVEATFWGTVLGRWDDTGLISCTEDELVLSSEDEEGAGARRRAGGVGRRRARRREGSGHGPGDVCVESDAEEGVEVLSPFRPGNEPAGPGEQ